MASNWTTAEKAFRQPEKAGLNIWLTAITATVFLKS